MATPAKGQIAIEYVALTLRSASLPPREPTRASATEGPLPGAKAGCHLPQAVSEAAMSDSACMSTSML